MKSRIRIGNGIYLNLIPDDRSKSNHLSLFFALPLTKENATDANLCAKLVQRGSRAYPTMRELNRALDYLYSASMGLSAFKQGELQIFNVNLTTMKDEYAIEQTDILKDCCEIAADVLFSPLTEVRHGREGFLRSYLESEIKNQKGNIAAQINNKAAWARKRCVDHMCREEAFSVNTGGDAELTDRADAALLLAFYRNLFQSAPVEIYFVGACDEGALARTLEKMFAATARNPAALPQTLVKTEVGEQKDITETLDVKQSNLLVGFRTGVTYDSREYLPFVLFNTVLGGSVTSKMFMNIREKLSLCYSCNAQSDYLKGVMFCYAGIDARNKEKTLDELYRQIGMIQSGNVTDDELANAKRYYANKMKELLDMPDSIPFWYYARSLAGVNATIASEAEEIMGVSGDEVVRCAEKIVTDTVYFLTSNETGVAQ